MVDTLLSLELSPRPLWGEGPPVRGRLNNFTVKYYLGLATRRNWCPGDGTGRCHDRIHPKGGMYAPPAHVALTFRSAGRALAENAAGTSALLRMSGCRRLVPKSDSGITTCACCWSPRRTQTPECLRHPQRRSLKEDLRRSVETLAQALDVVLVQLALAAQYFRHNAGRSEDVHEVFLLQAVLVHQEAHCVQRLCAR